MERTVRPQSELRWLFDAYTQTQKLRIGIGNRVDAVARETDQAPLSQSIGKLFADLEDAETAIYKDMEMALIGHPAMPWLGRVKGMGPTLSTKVLGLIEDIGKFDTVSKLWRFSGYAVIDGKRERPQGAFCPHCGARGRRKAHPCPVLGEIIEVKGGTLHYNIKLKSTIYLCGTSFLKSDSPYRKVYDDARFHYLLRETGRDAPWCVQRLTEMREKDADKNPTDRAKEAKKDIEGALKLRPDAWTLGHQHLSSMRKMTKLFLSHLWLTWREAEGLSIREPYVGEKLGHTTIIDPWDFVEPAAQ